MADVRRIDIDFIESTALEPEVTLCGEVLDAGRGCREGWRGHDPGPGRPGGGRDRAHRGGDELTRPIPGARPGCLFTISPADGQRKGCPGLVSGMHRTWAGARRATLPNAARDTRGPRVGFSAGRPVRPEMKGRAAFTALPWNLLLPPLRVDGTERERQHIRVRWLLDVQDHVGVGQGGEYHLPVAVGAHRRRTWCRWRRNVRREGDLPVTRRDVLRWSGHVLVDDRLARRAIAALVLADIGRRYRIGGQKGRRGAVTEPGGFPAAGQASADRLGAGRGADEVRALGLGGGGGQDGYQQHCRHREDEEDPSQHGCVLLTNLESVVPSLARWVDSASLPVRAGMGIVKSALRETT